MRYYKVNCSFGDPITIDETELEKAQYAHGTKKGTVFFKNGSVDAKDIRQVVPDYHKTMGWNYGHKMDSDDWDEINQKVGNMQHLIGEAAQNVKRYLAEGRPDLIGTGKLGLSAPRISKGVVRIGEALNG